MSAFLASIRNLAEARLAHRVGADWIDLKEPSEGALGAVEPHTVVEVVQWLARQKRAVFVSATIGDCWDSPQLMPQRVERLHANGVEYAKIGVFAQSPSAELLKVVHSCSAIGPKIILVCFAESPPSTRDLHAFAASGIAGAMLDTATKSGPSLCGLLSLAQLRDFVSTVHGDGLICGLAGSLRLDDISRLSPLEADYLGFRGALCHNAQRRSEFSESAAAQVRAALSGTEDYVVEPTMGSFEPGTSDVQSDQER